MKILVVSDSHGDDNAMMELYKEYPGMDCYLDAGDNLSDEYSLSPYRSVRGNCDYYHYDEKLLIRTSAGNVLMKHYPWLRDKERENLALFIHGHTHIYEIKKEENLIIFCPGSISRPRDGTNGTFGIIEINGDKISIDIIDIFTKNVLYHY